MIIASSAPIPSHCASSACHVDVTSDQCTYSSSAANPWKQLEVFSHTLLMFEVYGTRVLIIIIKEGYGLVREANEAADLSFPHCGGWVVHALLMFFTPPPSNPVFQSLVINGLYIICFGFISGQLVPTPFSSMNLTPTIQRAIFCCSGVH
jgi:hypothetical protein